jgi:hypothetical protein
VLPRPAPGRAELIPILGARAAQQLADNLTCLDVILPLDTLAQLDQASHITRGFPHDFLASADFIRGEQGTGWLFGALNTGRPANWDCRPTTMGCRSADPFMNEPS